jgi:ribosome-associated translation inhibitor RaiA
MVVTRGDIEYGRFTVVFHNMEPSDAVRVRAEHLLDKLLRFSPTIIRGTLTVEARHRHHHQGNVYHVSLNLHLPGRDIAVSHDPELNHAHEDVYVALRDACDAAKKQLASLERFSGKGAQHAKLRLEGNPRKGEPFGAT